MYIYISLAVDSRAFNPPRFRIRYGSRGRDDLFDEGLERARCSTIASFFFLERGEVI